MKAIVRSKLKAKSILSDSIESCSDRLEIVEMDLNNINDIKKLTSDIDALIWCASGFTDASSFLDKIKGLIQLKFAPKQIIDIIALREIGLQMKIRESNSVLDGPAVVVCSSAGTCTVYLSLYVCCLVMIGGLTVYYIRQELLGRHGQKLRRKNFLGPQIYQLLDSIL